MAVLSAAAVPSGTGTHGLATIAGFKALAIIAVPAVLPTATSVSGDSTSAYLSAVDFTTADSAAAAISTRD